MEPRMKNPAQVIDGAAAAIYGVIKSVQKTSAPAGILDLVHLRASQINGCSFCVDGGVTTAKKNGETDQRLHAVAAWRETPYFTDAERSALALSECVTRLADRSDPVPDDVWNEAAKHFDEEQLAAIVLHIATTNLFNRLNASTRQIAGSWG